MKNHQEKMQKMNNDAIKRSLLFAVLFFITMFFADMIYSETFSWKQVLRDSIVAVLSASLFFLMTRPKKRKD